MFDKHKTYSNVASLMKLTEHVLWGVVHTHQVEFLATQLSTSVHQPCKLRIRNCYFIYVLLSVQNNYVFHIIGICGKTVVVDQGFL